MFLIFHDRDREDEWNEIRDSLKNTCKEVLRIDDNQSIKSIFHRDGWRQSRRGGHSRSNVTGVGPDIRKLSPRNLIQRRTKRLGVSLSKIKREYFGSLAIQTEDATLSGNMKDLNNTTRS